MFVINLNTEYKNEQKAIDNLIFNLYAKEFNFSQDLKKKLENHYSIYKKKT